MVVYDELFGECLNIGAHIKETVSRVLGSLLPVIKSKFVTRVAWIFIVLSGLSTVMSIGENIMVMQGGQPAQMGGVAEYSGEYLHLYVVAFLMASVLMLCSSVGLLKRKNWARKLFLVLLSFSILWGVGRILLFFLFVPDPPSLPPGASEGVRQSIQQFENTHATMHLVMLLIFAAVSGLLIWIIHKLLSPEIQSEFRA